MSSSLTLAFDTSTTVGLVVVLKGQEVLSHKLWSREGSHGELLTPALQECLEIAKLKLTDVDQLAVGVGPGSFTGARISVNAAKALSYSLAKPVFTFDSTEVLASALARRDLPLLVMLNANKNQVYASTFVWTSGLWQRRDPLTSYRLENLDRIVSGAHLCLGDGFVEYADVLSPSLSALLVRDNAVSDAPSVASFQNLSALATRAPLVWKDIQALYVRASGAEEKLQEDLNKKI